MANIEISSSVTEFYRGRTIFVTGGTGFMGKVLVEKLLRSCSGIKRIYLLIREKTCSEPQDRLEQIFQSKLFDRVKIEQPNFRKKIVCVSGDLGLENLGISFEVYDVLTKEVSVIFHMGAVVKFNENLKIMVNRNVCGTKRMIDLAKKMDQLKAFVYVSTAYCNTHQKDIYETIYPTDFPAKNIIDCLSWMSDEMVESIRSNLLSRHPNNYCYSKCLTEQLLAEEANGIPVIIVRPTNVSSTFKEPIEGWIDTYNGTTLGYIAFCRGLGRVIYNPVKMMDFIPVDFCINLMVASVWSLSRISGPSKLVVYNCSTCTVNAAYSKKRCDYFCKLPTLYPSIKAYRYPYVTISTNTILYEIKNFLYHILPAVLFDSYLFITWKKPRMIAQYKKFHVLDKNMRYFYSHSWKFHAKNVERLLKMMSEEDKQIFDFDARNIDWDKFLDNFALHAREYLLKEDPSTLPLAKKHLKRLYQREIITRILIFGISIYLIPDKTRYVVTSWFHNISLMILQLITSFASSINIL